MSANTTDALWAIFKPKRVDTRKTGAEYQRLYEGLVRPVLGKRRIDKITFQDIEKLHHDLRMTPYQANRVLALLRVMFKYAIALRWITINPCAEVKMFPEQKRRRHMRPSEAPKIARCIALRENTAAPSCLFLWLVIFSGARSGEICDAVWSDLNGNVLTLKEHKTKNKTGIDRVIVLPPAAMEKLDKLAPVETRTPNGRIISIARPEVLWQRYLRVEAKCPDLRIHDLRHTFGTYALEKGYSLDQIGEALNHTSPTTTKIYAELTDRSRQRIANDVSIGILADMLVADAEDAYSPLV
jgi:integrase